VVVNPEGTVYPTSQRQYDRQRWLTSTADLFAGLSLIATHPTAQPTQNSDGTKTYQEQAGLGNGTVSVMRFLPRVTFVHVNDSITWTNNDPMEPHTVTFPAGSTTLPEPPDPAAFVPIGGATFDGTSPVSSGLLLPQGAGGTNSYTLTFTQPGHYNYECLLHDDMGMKGTIVVLP
jgi:plastocyanin